MNTTDIEDIWSIGTLWKPGIWFYYTFVNFLGVILCSVLIYHVVKNPKRTVSDIFSVGLCSGAITMSLTCGMQCLLNMTHDNRFFGGNIACRIEGCAHVTSIVVQFSNTALIALSMYYEVVHGKKIKPKTAIIMVIIIWFLCTLITGLLSLCSPLYLVSAGTYCFFTFESFAIAGWLLPMLVVSLVVMTICHYNVIKHFRNMLVENPVRKTEPALVIINSKKANFINNQDIFKKQFKWRSTLFIITLLLGWALFCVPTTIYELFIGTAPEWLVTGVGVMGVSYSVAMPLVYIYTSTFYKEKMKKFYDILSTYLCCKEQNKFRNIIHSLSSSNLRSNSDSEKIVRSHSSPPENRTSENKTGKIIQSHSNPLENKTETSRHILEKVIIDGIIQYVCYDTLHTNHVQCDGICNSPDNLQTESSVIKETPVINENETKINDTKENEQNTQTQAEINNNKENDHDTETQAEINNNKENKQDNQTPAEVNNNKEKEQDIQTPAEVNNNKENEKNIYTQFELHVNKENEQYTQNSIDFTMNTTVQCNSQEVSNL